MLLLASADLPAGQSMLSRGEQRPARGGRVAGVGRL